MLKHILCLIFISGFAMAQDCGLSGSIQQRIQDCNQKNMFGYVYKKGDQRILFESQTGKLWSTLPRSETFYNAISGCQLSFDNHGIISEGYEWRVSKAFELMRGVQTGVSRALYRNFKTYWGLKGRKYWKHKAYVFEIMDDGRGYATGSYIKLNHQSGHETFVKRHVMCVGVPVLQN